MDVYIWWTTEIDCKVIGPELSGEVPTYLASEYRSRFGRVGQGRLWIADQFGDVSCNWDDSKPAFQLVDAFKAAGIVSRTADIALLPDMGFVTDLDGNFIGRDGMVGWMLYLKHSIHPANLRARLWYMILGEFEITRENDWKVEAAQDGKAARVYHPRSENLKRLVDSFTNNRHLAWSEERRVKALAAVGRVLLRFNREDLRSFSGSSH